MGLMWCMPLPIMGPMRIKMRRQIKKYTIHILAIPAITPEVFDIPIRKCAIIACTNRDNKHLKLFPPKQRCIMPFADLEIPGDYRSINRAHARAIIRFLRQLPRGVTDLYVCCSKGGSRSPAVAAAVLRMSGRSDKVVWDNPYYVPNWLVYQTICREFGLFTPHCYVNYLVKRNRRAYQTLVKNGGVSKYERWQIIE